ncbi:four-carbon acid sugar kinase family protein [Fodinisporobacter ferrooxydans]|uniref:Four-carbon acid sugar kinase family protein n=1 Tax=Fodinisporobacter ferrooxydans TaxID=2901836 RepID=A0ABY4CSJ2_9BACL|nr:four-carbon acid sugar kinase family protein [Alicyclobacillaceae bacterium MYW30-H2]
MKRIAIIADDLTGASDSGVQLARKGLKTIVAIQSLRALMENEPEVIVLDTDSRAVSSELAYSKVKQLIDELKHAGMTGVYKKIDSTLRGNIGAEIDAILDVMDFDIAIVAPAFPKIQRVTKHGVHFLNGTEIHQTEIGKDPKCPVTESNISRLLSNQSKRKIGCMYLQTIRAGQMEIQESMEYMLQQGIEIIVADAEQEQDLIHLVDGLKNSSRKILWVGSAGLAQYLLELYDLPERLTHGLEVPKTDKPVMLVAGSISNITLQQLQAVGQLPNVERIQFDPILVLQGGEACEKEMKRCLYKVREAIRAGRDIALYATSTKAQVDETTACGSQFGINRAEIADRIASALGCIAAGILSTESLQGIILTGGDTAIAVCTQAGVAGLLLLDEMEPGIPVSRLIGGPQSVLTITKAGAFGTEESLVGAFHILKGECLHV